MTTTGKSGAAMLLEQSALKHRDEARRLAMRCRDAYRIEGPFKTACETLARIHDEVADRWQYLLDAARDA